MQGPHLTLSLWTDDPALAAVADAAGVDRVGPDLEIAGTAERQAGLGYRISCHRSDTLGEIAANLTTARLFARTNPVSEASASEVEELLEAGVEVLMLPMFRTAREVEQFASLVDRRATIVGLLEQSEAVLNIDAILGLEVLDEIHIGLNDLALSLGIPNRFELLETVMVEQVARAVHAAGIPLGVGGVGRVGDSSLPVDSDFMYRQLARLQASSTLLARSFIGGGEGLRTEVSRARQRLAELSDAKSAA